MAIVHPRATISPTKEDLLAAWIPTRPWGGRVAEKVAAYRFDDPAGEVGIEAFLVLLEDGHLVHAPLTYRSAPLEGVEAITTMDHSVLGTRHIYDGEHDPVCVTAYLACIASGSTGVTQEYEVDGRRGTRDTTAQVRGSGTLLDPTRARLHLARSLPFEPGTDAVLTATWDGAGSPAPVASATPA